MPQENNMAEVLRLLRTLIVKTDGLATDMKKVETRFDGVETRFDGVETRFDGVETRFDRLDAKVDFLAGRFEDVAGVVIQNTQRITLLEERIGTLQGKAN